ncbi:hypothetical protein ACG3SL_03370 [Sphingomonas sp. CJ20]
MIVALSLALAAQTAPPIQTAQAPQAAPIDWNGLAPLPLRAPPIVTPEMHRFVQREAVGRQCPVPGGTSMTVNVAVLIDENNGVRVTVPQSVQCPTVEQYAAALVAGFARGNLLPRMGGGDVWYRTSITFTWSK